MHFANSAHRRLHDIRDHGKSRGLFDGIEGIGQRMIQMITMTWGGSPTVSPSLCVKARKLIILAINKMIKTRNDDNGMPGTMVPWMDPGLPGHRTLSCLYVGMSTVGRMSRTYGAVRDQRLLANPVKVSYNKWARKRRT